MRNLRVALAVIAGVLWLAPAAAQEPVPAATYPSPVLITTGNTFQQLFAALAAGGKRRSLTIQNNTTGSDNCFVLIGGPWLAGDTTATSRTVSGKTVTAAQGAILLSPGASYARYSPFVPNDKIMVTCATTNDSVYADVQ
jgi:hypothetical protein